MSFVQDDALVNGKDTNQHAAKVKEGVVVHQSVALSDPEMMPKLRLLSVHPEKKQGTSPTGNHYWIYI